MFHIEFKEFQDLQTPNEIIIEYKSIRNGQEEYKQRYQALRRKTLDEALRQKDYQAIEEQNGDSKKELQDKLKKAEKEIEELKKKIREQENTVSKKYELIYQIILN